MPARLRRSTFQALALLSLALPAGAIWLFAPRAIGLFGVSDASIEVRVLVTVLVLLAATLVWAVLILPLRAMTDMPKLSDEFTALRAEGFNAALQRERTELERLGRSRYRIERRRYHGLMAIAGALVAAVAGFATWLMLAGEGEAIFISLPVAAVVGLVLAVYHFARMLLDSRGPGGPP